MNVECTFNEELVTVVGIVASAATKIAWVSYVDPSDILKIKQVEIESSATATTIGTAVTKIDEAAV